MIKKGSDFVIKLRTRNSRTYTRKELMQKIEKQIETAGKKQTESIKKLQEIAKDGKIKSTTLESILFRTIPLIEDRDGRRAFISLYDKIAYYDGKMKALGKVLQALRNTTDRLKVCIDDKEAVKEEAWYQHREDYFIFPVPANGWAHQIKQRYPQSRILSSDKYIINVGDYALYHQDNSYFIVRSGKVYDIWQFIKELSSDEREEYAKLLSIIFRIERTDVKIDAMQKKLDDKR